VNRTANTKTPRWQRGLNIPGTRGKAHMAEVKLNWGWVVWEVEDIVRKKDLGVTQSQMLVLHDLHL
jgi:hypothetical protein